MSKVTQELLRFKYEIDDDAEDLTSRAGLVVVVELFRICTSKKQWKRLAKALGYKKWRTVRRHLESLVLLIAGGGRHLDDIEVLRADLGLCKMLGYKPSSATQLKDFLYRFDQSEDGQQLSKEESKALSMQGEARIRPDGPGLLELKGLVDEIVAMLQTKRRMERVTLDVDATIIEARKETALYTYEGTTGYQPQMAWWAEQRVFVHDEFRDGNVPAIYGVLKFIQRALEALPEGVIQKRLRGDSALYVAKLLIWLHEQGIEFAVSVPITSGIAEAIKRLPESAWKPYRSFQELCGSKKCAEEREWAEVVDYIPEWQFNYKKYGQSFRYLAIRVRSRQGDLFVKPEEQWRYYAVVSNMDWHGERLLRWHREKQGTVEHGHDTLKNGLAAGTMPCGRFGSNAAWLRINVLVHVLLELIRSQEELSELARAEPKRLRFCLFNLPARLVRSGRQLKVRLSGRHPFARALMALRRAIAELGQAAQLHPMGAAPG